MFDLSHLIRQTLGITCREYVDRLQLERAVSPILGTDMPLIDVCMESGFSDCRYLRKAVMCKYGVSPVQLREGEAGKTHRLIGRSGLDGTEHEISETNPLYSVLLKRISSPESDEL